MSRKCTTPRNLSPETIAEINRQFVRETEEFSLIYRCQRCIHVIPTSGACSLRYPNHMLAEGPVRALDESGRFVFCKDFELGD